MRKPIIVAVTAAVLGLAAPASASHQDSWVTTKAKLALWTTPGVNSTEVYVDTIEGRVTLHGRVNSAVEKELAEREAAKVEGVRSIRNLLQIVPESKEKLVAESDAIVRKRVEKALKMDRAVGDGIKVRSVSNGMVVLGGKASTLSQHLNAVETTRGVAGVRRVATEVRAPMAMSDAEVAASRTERAAKDVWTTTEVKMRLIANPDVPALDVNVDTRRGAVVLFGIVPNDEAKRLAEVDARKVKGVEHVMNDIQVVPDSYRKVVDARDAQVKDAVMKKFDGRPDLRKVDVEVKNGVVRLTGRVPDEACKLEAAQVSRQADGARAVENDLQIQAKDKE